MATDEDLDRLATELPGVTVGRYWDDERAYLLPGRGGKGLAQRRSPRRQEGTVDPATDEPYTDLVVIHTATEQARAEALVSWTDSVFTIPHFARHAALLVHLDRITADDLEALMQLAWESKQR
ncbi:MAG: hypothetical protein ACK5MP_03375 [Nostocoides sp.]